MTDLQKTTNASCAASEPDCMERLGQSLIQHGKNSDRIYLMKLHPGDMPGLIDRLDALARERQYGKIFVKTPDRYRKAFLERGYEEEGSVAGYYRREEDCWFLARFLKQERRHLPDATEIGDVLRLCRETDVQTKDPNPVVRARPCLPEDAPAMAEIYREVFASYPFPIHEPDYLMRTMSENIRYFGIEENGRLVALSSGECYDEAGAVEMTDFATLPSHRGQGLATELLLAMEAALHSEGFSTAYTIARAISPGMNLVFARQGYEFGGTLHNNTQISGRLESMNIWAKPL